MGGFEKRQCLHYFELVVLCKSTVDDDSCALIAAPVLTYACSKYENALCVI